MKHKVSTMIKRTNTCCFGKSRKDAKKKAIQSLLDFGKCATEELREKEIKPEDELCLCGSFNTGKFGKRTIKKWVEGFEEAGFYLPESREEFFKVTDRVKRITKESEDREDLTRNIKQDPHLSNEVKELFSYAECSDIDGGIEVQEKDYGKKLSIKEEEQMMDKCNGRAREIAPGKYLPTFIINPLELEGEEECTCKRRREWSNTL